MVRSSSTKAQVWSVDLLVAIVIFTTAIILFYQYSLNSIDTQTEDRDQLLQNAKLISSYLVAAGYPESWDPTNITLLGLTDGNHNLNAQKVADFEAMNYDTAKDLLATKKDFYVFFEDRYNESVSIGGITEIGRDYTLDNPDNLIKVQRFVYYNSSIIRMGVFVW